MFSFSTIYQKLWATAYLNPILLGAVVFSSLAAAQAADCPESNNLLEIIDTVAISCLQMVWQCFMEPYAGPFPGPGAADAGIGLHPDISAIADNCSRHELLRCGSQWWLDNPGHRASGIFFFSESLNFTLNGVLPDLNFSQAAAQLAPWCCP